MNAKQIKRHLARYGRYGVETPAAKRQRVDPKQDDIDPYGINIDPNESDDDLPDFTPPLFEWEDWEDSDEWSDEDDEITRALAELRLGTDAPVNADMLLATLRDQALDKNLVDADVEWVTGLCRELVGWKVLRGDVSYHVALEVVDLLRRHCGDSMTKRRLELLPRSWAQVRRLAKDTAIERATTVVFWSCPMTFYTPENERAAMDASNAAPVRALVAFGVAAAWLLL
jgi:hypothetical protein